MLMDITKFTLHQTLVGEKSSLFIAKANKHISSHITQNNIISLKKSTKESR